MKSITDDIDIESLNNRELLLFHFLAHQAWGRMYRGETSISEEKIIEIHNKIFKQMHFRKIPHRDHSSLDATVEVMELSIPPDPIVLSITYYEYEDGALKAVEDALSMVPEDLVYRVELSFTEPPREKPYDFLIMAHHNSDSLHLDFIIPHIDEGFKIDANTETNKAIPSEQELFEKMVSNSTFGWPLTEERVSCVLWDKEDSRESSGLTSLKHKGQLSLGAHKPDFFEYFLDDSTRVIFKFIPKERDSKGTGFWLTWVPEDQTPYVLTESAITKSWLPQGGISALPLWLKSRIPDSLAYWNMEGERALDARKELSLLYKMSDITILESRDNHYIGMCDNGNRYIVRNDEGHLLTIGATYKRFELTDFPHEKAVQNKHFTLQHHRWEDPFHLNQTSVEHWDLTLAGRMYVLEHNPIESETIALRRAPYNHLWVNMGRGGEQEVPPKSAGNPTRNPAYVRLVDEGIATILKGTNGHMKVEFKGESLNGVYSFDKNPNANVWNVKKIVSTKLSISVPSSSTNKLSYDHLPDGTLRVTGAILSEGVWHGQGGTFFFSRDVITRDYPRLNQNKFPLAVGSHELPQNTIDGYPEQLELLEDGTIWSSWIITDKQKVVDVISGDYEDGGGFSVEVDVIADPVREIIEEILHWTRTNLVDNPACLVCTVDQVQAT